MGRTHFPIRKVNSSIAFCGSTHYSPSIGCKEGLFAPCFVRRLRTSGGVDGIAIKCACDPAGYLRDQMAALRVNDTHDTYDSLVSILYLSSSQRG